MAKKWADVVGSEAFQALPDDQKEVARNQYFDSVVAPQVPETDLDAVRQQFLSTTSLGPKKAPAKPAPAPQGGGFEQTNPAGDDFGSAIMAAAQQSQPEPKYRSVLERPEFQEFPISEAEATRLSRRDYAEGTSKEAQRLAGIGKQKLEAQAAKRNQLRKGAEAEDYGFLDFAKDSGLDLAKGAVGLGEAYVGLLNLTSGGSAGRVLGRMGYDPEATNKFLNGFQSLTRKNARESVEEAQGFINTLGALAVNPTELLGSIVESLPGTVTSGAAAGQYVRFLAGRAAEDAAARGLSGAAAKEFIRDRVVQSTGKIAAAAGGAEGVQTTGSIAEKGRQAGRDWEDYVAPALAAGFGTAAISSLSGKAASKFGLGDVETAIAARSAGVKDVGLNKASFGKALFGDMVKEGFFEEMPQSAQEQIFSNLATGKPWDTNVDKAAAKGLASGMGMAGGMVAYNKAKQRAGEYITQRLNEYDEKRYQRPDDSGYYQALLEAKSKGFLTPERRNQMVAPEQTADGRVEPTFDEEKFTAPPTAPAPQADREEQLAALTAEIEATGIPTEDAQVQAQQMLAVREAEERKALAPRIIELTREFVDNGMEPQQANQLAIQQATEEAQADAQAEREGAVNAQPTVSTADRTSAEMAGQPGGVAPTAGAGVTEPTGVVPAGQTAAGTVAGEGEQPGALSEKEIAEFDARVESAKRTAQINFASALDQVNDPMYGGDLDAALDSYRQNTLDTLSEEGEKDPDVVLRAEREFDRLVEAHKTPPAAEAPKTKRGRPAVLTEEEKQQRAEDKRPVQAAKAKAERSLIRLTNKLDELATLPDEGDFETDEDYEAALADHRAERRETIKSLLQMQADPLLRGTKVGERVKVALARPDISEKEKADLKAGIEAQKRAQGDRPSSSRVTKGTPDTTFGKFTNGVQALNHIIKTGTDFQKALGKRLRSFVTNVKFVVIEEGQELPAQLKTTKNARHWERSIALYIENYNTGDRVIYVRGASFGENQGINNLTILHELLHAATNRKIVLAIEAIKKGANLSSPLVRSAGDLLRTMNSAISTFNDMSARGQLPEYISLLADKGEVLEDPREFIAYGMTDPDFQKFLMQAQGYEEDTSYFTRFVRGIRELFGMGEDTTNAFTDLIVVTDTILSTKAPQYRARVGEQVSPTAKGEEAPMEQVLRPLPPVLMDREGRTPSLKRRIDALRRRRDAGQLTDTQFAEEVDAVAEAVENAKYQKPTLKRQRGADYIRQRILEAKRKGEISEEAADLAEWFILQNPALVEDLGISFRAKGNAGVGGQYFDVTRVAKIIKEGGNTGTIVHEVLHHLERMMPEDIRVALRKEWYRQFLKAQDKADTDAQKKFFDLLTTYHSDSGKLADFTAATDMLKDGAVPIEFYQYVNPSEFWAVNGTRIVEGNFEAVQGNVLTKLKNWLGQLAQKLKGVFNLSSDAPVIRALESMAKADGKFVSKKLLQEEGVYQSITPEPTEEAEEPEAVEAAVRTQKQLNRAVNVASAKFDASQSGEEYAKAVSLLQMMQDPRKVIPFLRELYQGMNRGARVAFTYAMTTDFMAEMAADTVPELKNTDKLMQKMSGMTQTLLKAAGDLTNDISRAYRKDPTLRDKLDKITHMATLAEYDPADKSQTLRNKKLDQMYDDLGSEGQRVYNRIKKHFEVLSNYFTKLLDDQITQSGLPIAEQANLIKKIRAMYETGSKITPYFPLVRRGDYWLSIGSGATRQFFMFESMGERDRAMQGFADEKVKQKPGESNAAFQKRRAQNMQDLLESEDFVFGNDISSLRKTTVGNSELLTGVFGEIDKVGAGTEFSPEAKEQLKDAVYQIYLQTMPEQSFRKQFIHRKGFAGFRTDLLRNVADTTTKMATQLARIKYAPLLRNSLSQARDSIKNRPTYEPYVSAFERRVSDALSAGKPSMAESIAAWSNKFSFIYYLGGMSSAMLQPLSLFQTGIPVLTKYGTGNAYAEMGNMLKVWKEYGVMQKNADGTYSWVAPSIENVTRSADERRAIKDMLGRDITTSTYASDALDYKATPTDDISSPAVQFGKDTVSALVLGGLMHSTERLSREAMFLASYRLNRKAGRDHETAVDNAVIDTNEALGNYGQYNRPDFMKGAAGKVLTQFMMYPVHMTIFMGKNFVEMIKPMNGRTRWEASKKFFGTMGHTWVLGGAVGLWGFSTVMGFLGAMWNSLKDDEWPEDVKSMSYELWWRTVWLKEQLGGTQIAGADLADIVERGPVNAITGADISSRTSLNNMWLRDTKETATPRESVIAMAMEKAGPTANMILSWADAYGAFMEGDYKKGVLKAAPAGFRNYINAYGYWKEGAKDNKGTEILSRDAFSTGDLIFQAVGFRSDLLANTQYVTFKVIGLEQKILNERNKVMNRLDRAYREKDFDTYTKSYKDMEEFNRKYPTYEITADNLVESLERREEQRATSFRGVTLTEKNVAPFAEALIPSRVAADKREEKNRQK